MNGFLGPDFFFKFGEELKELVPPALSRQTRKSLSTESIKESDNLILTIPSQASFFLQVDNYFLPYNPI